mmetsp:Transcript_5535/g.11660  ORF Transcript_5535/g.11660 Transcript_5535/m.11660 type:complete len:298 (-) Transcript_5535:42-935(-)
MSANFEYSFEATFRTASSSFSVFFVAIFPTDLSASPSFAATLLPSTFAATFLSSTTVCFEGVWSNVPPSFVVAADFVACELASNFDSFISASPCCVLLVSFLSSIMLSFLPTTSFTTLSSLYTIRSAATRNSTETCLPSVNCTAYEICCFPSLPASSFGTTITPSTASFVSGFVTLTGQLIPYISRSSYRVCSSQSAKEFTLYTWRYLVKSKYTPTTLPLFARSTLDALDFRASYQILHPTGNFVFDATLGTSGCRLSMEMSSVSESSVATFEMSSGGVSSDSSCFTRIGNDIIIFV